MGAAKGAPDAIDLGAVKIGVSDYVSQGNAILGIRDSGKSYTATYLAEQLLRREVPFVAFDPIGVWKYLRYGEFTGRGWDLIVAGGEDGDVPLTVDNCEAIVRHAMTKNLPLVLDLYSINMSKADWRRIVEKSVRLMLYDNKKHGLRHIFIEEAAEFVPQMVQREHAQVYAEIEKLARMGGNAMLGYTLINQRAEQVNKAVLELCDCLFLHRQKGRNSLTALTKWLEFGDKKKSGAIIEALPTLEQGECYIWQGGETTPEHTHVPKKQSFHPNRRERTNPPGNRTTVLHMLAGLELELQPPAVRGNHSRTHDAARAAAGDPRDWPKAEPEIIRVPVFEQGEIAKLELALSQAQDVQRSVEITLANLGVATRAISEAMKRADAITQTANRPRPTPKPREADKPTVQAQGPQRILAALAARYPLRLTQSQLGTICGFTPSTMRTYMPRLREAGFLSENAEGVGLSDAGTIHCHEYVPKIAMPSNGIELLEFWKSKLNQGEATILQALYDAGKRRLGALNTQELANHTGYTESTLRTYIPVLRRNNLIDPTELRIKPEFLK